MSLDSNTWYTIQSFGTDYNLAVGNATADGGSVFSQSNGRAPNALWQKVNPGGGDSPSYLRSQQKGANFCLSGAEGQLSVTECTNTAVWTIATFSSENESEGYYLAPGASATSPRLNEAESGNVVSLQQYPAPNGGDTYFQWAFRSVSAINDQSFSTISSGGPSTSSTSSSSTSTGSSSSTSTSSSSTSSPTTTTTTTTTSTTTTTPQVETITFTQTGDPSTPPPEPETSTLIVTRSATDNTVAPPTSTSPAVSPTTIPGNAASGNTISVRNVMVLGLLGVAAGMNFL